MGAARLAAAGRAVAPTPALAETTPARIGQPPDLPRDHHGRSRHRAPYANGYDTANTALLDWLEHAIDHTT